MPWRREQCVAAARAALCACALTTIIGTAPSRAQAPIGLTEDIPPQPLAQALAAFARQTGLQLVYVSSIARGRTSKGAAAGLTRSAALARLLEGTGLRFEVLNDRSVRILADTAGHSPARAPPPSERGADGPPRGLEEITVTANALEQALSRVPISISVWTQKDMEASGVRDLTDLAALAPGIHYEFSSINGPGFSSSVVTRGITQTGVEPTTGIYLDDTPIRGRTLATGGYGNLLPVTFDLERVEILRGPQPVFGGDTALGGAIYFITNKPSLTDWSGFARSEVATTDGGGMSYEAGGALGGPIVPDVIGFRLSLWSRWDGGYVDRTDPFTGATVDANANRARTQSLRAALLFVPTEGVRITPALTYQSRDLHDTGIFNTDVSDPNAGVFKNYSLLRQPFGDEFYLASVKITAELRHADLTTVTAYWRRYAYVIGENEPYPPPPTSYLDAVASDYPIWQQSLSQEIRLGSSNAISRVGWIVGAWFEHETEEAQVDSIPVDPSNVANLSYTHLSGWTTQIDGFGEVDLKLTHDFTATLGLRVGHSRYATGSANGSTNAPALTYAPSAGETPVAPRFALSHSSDRYGLLYLSIAKGYQLGGTNYPNTISCGSAFTPTYGPDRLWSYELGAKERLFDARVYLDASLFYLDWRNIQTGIHSCGGIVVNGGTAASDGFDFSVRAAVTDRVRLAAVVEYANARYTSTVHLADGTVVQSGTVVEGLGVAPPWTANFSAEADLYRTAQITVALRVEDAVHSRNTVIPFNTSYPAGPGGSQPGGSQYFLGALNADPAINLVNASMRFAWAGYEVTAFATNVLDSLPLLSRQPLIQGYPLTYAGTLRPRTVGLSASWRF